MAAIENRQGRVHRRVNAPRGVSYPQFEGDDLYGGVYERNGSHNAMQRDTQHFTTSAFYNADTEARLNDGQHQNNYQLYDPTGDEPQRQEKPQKKKRAAVSVNLILIKPNNFTLRTQNKRNRNWSPDQINEDGSDHILPKH